MVVVLTGLCLAVSSCGDDDDLDDLDDDDVSGDADTDTDSDGDTETSTDDCAGFEGREPYYDDEGNCVQCLAGYCDEKPKLCETSYEERMQDIEEDMEEDIQDDGLCGFIIQVYRCVDGKHMAFLEVIDGKDYFFYDQNGNPIGMHMVIDTETWCSTSWSLRIGDTNCEPECTELFCPRWEGEESEYPYCDE